jgi:hypothetical protein
VDDWEPERNLAIALGIRPDLRSPTQRRLAGDKPHLHLILPEDKVERFCRHLVRAPQAKPWACPFCQPQLKNRRTT